MDEYVGGCQEAVGADGEQVGRAGAAADEVDGAGGRCGGLCGGLGACGQLVGLVDLACHGPDDLGGPPGIGRAGGQGAEDRVATSGLGRHAGRPVGCAGGVDAPDPSGAALLGDRGVHRRVAGGGVDQPGVVQILGAVTPRLPDWWDGGVGRGVIGGGVGGGGVVGCRGRTEEGLGPWRELRGDDTEYRTLGVQGCGAAGRHIAAADEDDLGVPDIQSGQYESHGYSSRSRKGAVEGVQSGRAVGFSQGHVEVPSLIEVRRWLFPAICPSATAMRQKTHTAGVGCVRCQGAFVTTGSPETSHRR